MLSLPVLTLAAIISLLANLAADWILATRYRTSFALDTARRRAMRVLRWLLATLGLMTAALAGLTMWQLLMLGLLAVSAATDLVLQPEVHSRNMRRSFDAGLRNLDA